MSPVHGLAVHQGTTTDDAPEAARFTFADRLGGDAAGAERPVKPHLGDAACGALAYELYGNARRGGDHEAVEGSRYGGEVRIAADAFGLAGIRVDREHLESRGSQFTINGVRGLGGISRDAGDGKAFA
jgi:hypothetical protein